MNDKIYGLVCTVSFYNRIFAYGQHEPVQYVHIARFPFAVHYIAPMPGPCQCTQESRDSNRINVHRAHILLMQRVCVIFSFAIQ